jgi:hypothetical protein
MPARGAAEPQRIGTFTRAQRRSRGSQPTMGELRLHGAVRRDPRTTRSWLMQMQSRLARAVENLASIAHSRRSRAGPTLHQTSKATTTTRAQTKQKPENRSANESQQIPMDDRSGKATRGTWEARHRAGGHGRRAPRDTGKRRATQSRAVIARSSATGAHSRPEKAETAAGCLLASGDERTHGFLIRKTATANKLAVRVSASRFGPFWVWGRQT